MRNSRQNLVELWRTGPFNLPLKDKRRFTLKYIFPSGRQAIACSLKHAGLSRSRRMAFPEWSSHCVISALGRHVTPVPLNEVLKYGIEIDAVLLYEQWGWPFTNSAWEALEERFKNKIIILDMVDSADFYFNRRECPNCKTLIEILSLNKILGLRGGGLAYFNRRPLVFAPTLKSQLTKMLDDQRKNSIFKKDFGYRDYFQNSDQAVNPAIVNWVKQNDLLGAIEAEREIRQNNLHFLLRSRFSSCWPKWMVDVVENGAGPGIAPIMKGAGEKRLRTLASVLEKEHKMRAVIYHFNWSGNPLKPSYEKCLAVPVHGMVKDLYSILKNIR